MSDTQQAASALRDALAAIEPGERKVLNGFEVTRSTRTRRLLVVGREGTDGLVEPLDAEEIDAVMSNGTGHRSSLNALALSGLLRCCRGRYLPGPVAEGQL